ncbi:hypothetical protein RB195_010577 [Necator americanus]|uniref:Uncharacterized protein n=1 Tax=Necator americanus TaxID=51031 RepID=A0ABR1CZV9_NECAM
MMSSTAKLTITGPAAAPCLIPLPTLNGGVDSAGVQTAGAVLLFMSLAECANFLGISSVRNELRVEKTAAERRAGTGFEVQKDSSA